MNSLIDFIYKNKLYIFGFIVAFVSIIIILSFFGIDLSTKPPNKKLVQVVTLETMANLQDSDSGSSSSSMPSSQSSQSSSKTGSGSNGGSNGGGGNERPSISKIYSQIFLNNPPCKKCAPCEKSRNKHGKRDNTNEDDGTGRNRRKKPHGNIPENVRPSAEIDMEAEKEFKELNLDPSTSFCEQNKTNGIKLQAECSLLTGTKCGQTSCCVWANGKCAAGNMRGALFKMDKSGEPINIDTYYYKGTCYGEGCSDATTPYIGA